MKVQNIAIGLLRTNPNNPRDMQRDQDLDSLAASIAQSGVLVPLIVRKADGEDGKKFEVLAGHRRLMAAEGILTDLPCVVTTEEHGDGVVVALIENTQRVDLSALETARAVAAALKTMKPTALADAIGRSASYISKMKKIIKAEQFLTSQGTDAAYFGDYTNYEELYEHAREVLGEVVPPPPKPKQQQLPGTNEHDETETDIDALRSLIDGHCDVAKVKPIAVEIEEAKDGSKELRVEFQFKTLGQASKFFAAYGVKS